MNKTKTYYQPYLKFEGESELYFPEEALCSFHAFATKEDATQFIVELTDYSNYELVIEEYHDEDIEGVTILDGEGNVVEINEEDEDESIEDVVKSVCYGRDDLLALAEKIVEESGIEEADGEVLCEELARTCRDYLMWAGTPVKK